MTKRKGGAIAGPFYIDATDVHAYSVKLSTSAKVTPGKMRSKVRHWTGLLLTQVKRNANLPASGPPGPRQISGDYNRSITREYEDAGTAFTGSVGTNADQGRRLEFGFFGTDSLGRNYHQPAYAHFRPAADTIEPQYVNDMSNTFGKDL